MKKRWIGHVFALTGLLVFSVLGMGKATAPRAVGPAVPGVGAAAAAEAPVAVAAPEAAPIAPAAVTVTPGVQHPGLGMTHTRISGSSWVPYTIIPSKNYTVVGLVVIRNTSSETFLADLMERAIAMGGHHIKNVRLSKIPTDYGFTVNAATAVAIRYTNETLMTPFLMPPVPEGYTWGEVYEGISGFSPVAR